LVVLDALDVLKYLGCGLKTIPIVVALLLEVYASLIQTTSREVPGVFSPNFIRSNHFYVVLVVV